MPASASAWRSKASTSVTASASAFDSRCQAWSSSAAARYSVVENPSLKPAESLRPRTSSGRHRRPGLVVLGVVRQHLGPRDPHLVDLARELDEVPLDVRPREPGVGRAGDEAVQRVSELVEQRLDLVLDQQGRRARGGLGDVEVVHDDGQRPHQGGLLDDRVHPRTTALAVTRVQVEQVQPDGGVVLVGDLEHADLVVVAAQVRALGELQPVERVRGEEHPVVQDPVGLEVRAGGRAVRGELLAPQDLGRVRPVPCLDVVPERPGPHGTFVVRVRCGGGHQGGQQTVDGLGGLGGLVRGDDGGVVREAEQFGALSTQPDDAQQDVAVVVLVPAAATGERRAHDPLAQAAVTERRQPRVPGVERQRDEPAVEPTVSRLLRRRRTSRRRRVRPAPARR